MMLWSMRTLGYVLVFLAAVPLLFLFLLWLASLAGFPVEAI
jgi:hypothetical protein